MKPIIQVQNVSQRFATQGGDFLALQNVTFDIAAAAVADLLSERGAGGGSYLRPHTQPRRTRRVDHA